MLAPTLLAKHIDLDGIDLEETLMSLGNVKRYLKKGDEAYMPNILK
jgi:hypothetical protein